MATRAVLLGCSILAAGCAASKPRAATANDATALLLELSPQCPTPVAAPADSHEPLRVFVEMLVVDVDAARLRSASSVDALLADPTTEVTSMHVLADNGAQSELTGARVTPRVDTASSQIAIDVATDAPPAQATVVLANGQRAILGSDLHDGRRKVTMLVPTIVRSRADLQRLHDCKKARPSLRERPASSQPIPSRARVEQSDTR